LRRHREHLTRVTGCWTAVVLLLIAVIYLGKLSDEFSRGWILLWAVSGWLGLMGTRALTWRVMRWLRARGQLVTHIAVVGHGVAAERCAQRLQGDSNGDVQVIGVFEASDAPNDAQGSYPRRDLGDLGRLAANMWIDEIVVAAQCDDIAELGSPLSKFCTL